MRTHTRGEEREREREREREWYLDFGAKLMSNTATGNICIGESIARIFALSST